MAVPASNVGGRGHGHVRNRNRRREADGPDRGGHGGHDGKGDGKGKGKNNQAKALRSLLDPSKNLKGKDLLKVSRGLTRLETKPQINALKRLMNELRGQQTADVTGLKNLRTDTSRKIGQAYAGADRGAQAGQLQTAAVGEMLNREIQGVNQQAADQLAGVQTGELGGHREALALRGAPGGGMAQQQLADLAQQSAARSALEGQAGGQFAAAMGANYAGLAGGMRQATQMQGAEAQSDLERMMAARIAQTKLESGADIREAMGQKADVRKLRGETMLKHLMEMRESERDYKLGKAAVQTDRRGQTLSARSDAADRRSREAIARADNRFDAADREDEQRHDASQAAKDRKADKGGNKKEQRQKARERKAEKKDAKAIMNPMIRDLAREHPDDWEALIRSDMSGFITEVATASGASTRVVRALLKRYLKRA